MDMGADICCDSAHKTLPVITGGAYLHIADEKFAKDAKNALAMFGSTSPSYLILQSLDFANKYLADYPETLARFIKSVYNFKEMLADYGYTLCGDEPLKITVRTKPFGYTGTEFAEILRSGNIECEFADPDFLVLMLTPETGDGGIEKIKKAMLSVEKKEAINENPPEFGLPERVMSAREAAFSEWETVSVSESEGRILAAATVGCPPAVPIVCSGERIDKKAIECFEYYGIEKTEVVK
jgi:arginine/lysine/ornithine decarboxylase